MLKEFVKSIVPPGFYERLKRGKREFRGFLHRHDLRQLATIYGTDKWGDHWYMEHYQRHFQHLRTKKLTLLEIGIGGYAKPAAGGQSLRVWRRYFPNARIVGVDYHDKSPHTEARIKIYRGDQSDEKFLRRMIGEIGRPEIIIDDGSHNNAHVLKTFEVLFPLLADNGIYVVEDTQTAYWPDYGGSSDDLVNAPTSLRCFKNLTDGLNHEELLKPGYVPTYYDRHITALHFYHNLVFIQKGENQEGSNLVRNGQLTLTKPPA